LLLGVHYGSSLTQAMGIFRTFMSLLSGTQELSISFIQGGRTFTSVVSQRTHSVTKEPFLNSCRSRCFSEERGYSG